MEYETSINTFDFRWYCLSKKYFRFYIERTSFCLYILLTDWLLAEYIPLEPHDSICVQELLRFLTVICNPHDKQNTDVMIQIGLSLLTIALEVGANSIFRHPTLLAIVEDTLCRNLLAVCINLILHEWMRNGNNFL